ncbi:MAG: hypothetical protein ACP5N3_04680 [Candidatus Nanoarchaeia archaeon]
MRKNIILRTVMAVVLVLVISFISFILTSDFNDFLSGRAVAQVYITPANITNCSVILKQGVNTVSFFCVDETKSINESMKNVYDSGLNYYAIFSYNPNNINDSWSSYNPGLPSLAVQSIHSLDRRKGYAVVMNSQEEFFSDGYRFTNTRISLQNGWNFIGYPSDVEANISEVLAAIEGEYTKVETYQIINGSNYWRDFIPGVGGDLDTMEPMIGYWIFMNETDILIIT